MTPLAHANVKRPTSTELSRRILAFRPGRVVAVKDCPNGFVNNLWIVCQQDCLYGLGVDGCNDAVRTQDSAGLISTLGQEPPVSGLPHRSTAPGDDGNAVIGERLRRYFSDFTAAYILEEVRRTGKPLGIVVEELLTDRVSVA